MVLHTIDIGSIPVGATIIEECWNGFIASADSALCLRVGDKEMDNEY